MSADPSETVSSPSDTSPRRFNPDAKGPLAGVRVLDLSRLVAGNMLSLQLADFGADVIKVEPPEGDPLRDWRDGGEQLFWKTYSRNKMSIVLNLRHAEAKDALLRLVETADVFIENYRPGTLEKMGLGPDILLARNPNIIVVRISGFGQTGPYAHLPGFGTLVEAMSGFAARTGFPDREPVLPPLALADMIAGLSGAMATTTALFARKNGMSGGQVIDLSPARAALLGPGPGGRHLQADRPRQAARGQRLQHLGAAQHLSLRGRQIRGLVRLDADHGETHLRGHRPPGDDRGSALPDQHRSRQKPAAGR